MRDAPMQPPAEQSISDGMRHLGHLTTKADQFECYDAAGAYLCKATSVAEVRSAILTADRRAA